MPTKLTNSFTTHFVVYCPQPSGSTDSNSINAS